MAIYLVRHGETHANAARVVQTPDVPLSARGLAQADRLARRLAGAGISRILASDLVRAAMTAEHIRAATGAALELDPLLQERNFGDLRGTPYDALGIDLFGAGYAPPGGETWEAFHARVDRAWERVRRAAERAEGNLAVVTHGLVCHSVTSRLAELPRGTAVSMRFANTGITILEPAPPHAVTLFNCTAHLGTGCDDDPRSASGI